MDSQTRIYRVSADGKSRLIRARNGASAIRHAASGYTARVASQEDIFELASAGVKIEVAGEHADDDKPAASRK